MFNLKKEGLKGAATALALTGGAAYAVDKTDEHGERYMTVPRTENHAPKVVGTVELTSNTKGLDYSIADARTAVITTVKVAGRKHNGSFSIGTPLFGGAPERVVVNYDELLNNTDVNKVVDGVGVLGFAKRLDSEPTGSAAVYGYKGIKLGPVPLTVFAGADFHGKDGTGKNVTPFVEVVSSFSEQIPIGNLAVTVAGGVYDFERPNLPAFGFYGRGGVALSVSLGEKVSVKGEVNACMYETYDKPDITGSVSLSREF